MQDAIPKVWLREAHVPAELLVSLRELNHRFLDLVAAHPGDWCTSVRGLSLAVAAEVRPLSAAQKAAAANCPYALFDLRFGDEQFWRARLADAGRVVADGGIEPDIVEFARLALFFAWHAAASAKAAAPLLLGMHEATAAGFRRLTIDCLPALAVGAAEHMTARWSDWPSYWRALAGAAIRHNVSHLRRIQLYGLQLAAAERLDEHCMR